MIAEINQAGFDVRRADKARVAVERVVDETGQVLETRRFVEVIPGMRFLDLEHELGHVRQLERQAVEMPTETFVRRADGGEVQATNTLRSGTMRSEHDRIFEYHNRLDEWIRLAERGASRELLLEHADGVVRWRMRAEAAGLGRSGGRGQLDAWARASVSDLPALEQRAVELGLELGKRSWRW